MTAINVEDVPRIMHQIAVLYRGNQTRRHPHVWLLIADEMERFAGELSLKIDDAKKHPPKRERVLIE